MQSEDEVRQRLGNLLETVPQGHFVYTYPPHKIYPALEGELDFETAWAETPTGDLNVYVHIPFCRQRCNYCNIESMISRKEGDEKVDRYLDALVTEMDMYADALSPFTVSTIYIGGGTPSLLSAEQMRVLFRNINSHVTDTSQLKEFCIELSPDTMTGEKIDVLDEFGMSRISLGVQSFDDNHIKRMGRKYGAETPQTLLSALHRAGFTNINVDIIYGHPEQTMKMLHESIVKSIDVEPGTISLYPLNVKPITPFWKMIGPDGLDRQKIDAMYEMGRALLLENGYVQDTRLRFVRPSIGRYAHKDETVKGKPVKGFGAAAQSYAERVHYRPSYSVSHCRQDIMEYMTDIEAGRHPARFAFFLSDEELMRRTIIMNIRHSTLSIRGFEARFGTSPQDAFPHEFNVLSQDSYIEKDKDIIRLTEKGYKRANCVSKLFFSEEVLRRQKAYVYV